MSGYDSMSGDVDDLAAAIVAAVTTHAMWHLDLGTLRARAARWDLE